MTKINYKKGIMKFKLWVATNKVGSKCSTTIEVDKENWENMNELERCDYMHEHLMGSSMIEWGYNEEENEK